MPNLINANGLQTKTRQEIVTELEDGFKLIYGNDINLESDSPDAQLINILAQTLVDQLEFLKQVYNSFTPDNAIGVVLDQRVALNGIQRQGGTFSRTNITIVVSQSINLFGLDQFVETVFTVADNQGNEWQLLESESLAIGTHVLEFQSVAPGQVISTPNTITSPVTVILGVTSVNNPTVQSVVGINEETDEQLRVRRQRSVSLASQGYLASLRAALLNITGVSSAFIYENNTAAIDSDGVPAHSIWVIVSGNYANADIANAIYQKRNAGAGMFGAISFTVTQVDGSPFIVNWDEVDEIPLFVELNLSSIDGIIDPDYVTIKSSIVSNYIPDVYETVNSNKLASIVLGADSNALVVSSGFSTAVDGSYTQILQPSSKDKQFVITAPNVVLLPILINPKAQTIGTEIEIQFSALGGFGAYTWSLQVDNSGASLNTSTGLYESGTTPGADTIRVTDEEGNFSDVIITVA